jgi:two-component system, response regulator RpfG
MNVLIVDDQASQRAIVRHLIQDIDADIKINEFADPVEALLFSQQEPQDMVILDYRMPNMDGLEFARRFRRPLSQRDVPVVLVTVVGDEPVRQAALDAGIIDFMVKPIRPRELRSRCKNLLDLRQRQQALKSRTYALEHKLLAGTQDTEQRELALLTRLARLACQREGGDLRLFERVSALSAVLADGLGLGERQARAIEHAAQLHDIGNIGLPDAIFSQPGPLDPGQRLLMQQHTVLGHEALQGGSGLLQLGAEIALNHHERWDGGGYPNGLAGERIPKSARIVAVADVLDALHRPRPWRPAWTAEAALAHIHDGAGSHFDPAVVAVLGARQAAIVATLEAYEGD